MPLFCPSSCPTSYTMYIILFTEALVLAPSHLNRKSNYIRLGFQALDLCVIQRLGFQFGYPKKSLFDSHVCQEFVSYSNHVDRLWDPPILPFYRFLGLFPQE